MKILLTGKPSVGKTTLILKVLSVCNFNAGGFYTREIRKEGTRTGFEIYSLDGVRGILAHRKFKSRFRVGRYGVNIEAVERIGVKSIEDAMEKSELIVVDEIGKMELCSQNFADTVLRALQSDEHLLATIMKNPHPIADMIKQRRDTKLINVTYENRDSLVEEISSLLTR